jgi:hypothetical protein
MAFLKCGDADTPVSTVEIVERARSSEGIGVRSLARKKKRVTGIGEQMDTADLRKEFPSTIW